MRRSRPSLLRESGAALLAADQREDDADPSDATMPPAGRVSEMVRPHYQRHRIGAQVALYLIATVGAWHTRFVQDDAFISFRYAKNLAEGRGLVFNPGERVEGYTNFLWTVLMAIPERLGLSTPLFSQFLGVVLFLATLAIAQRFARNVLADEVLAYLAAVFLITNMTFLSYATGGLETMLQTLLITGFSALLLPVDRALKGQLRRRRLIAGVVAGLAILTRLDSAVLVSVVAIVHATVASRDQAMERRPFLILSAMTTMVIPAVLLVGPWFVWKVGYYGEWLPNTFVAKSDSSRLGPILFGLVYLAAFFVGYFYFLLVGRFRRHRSEFFSRPGTRQVFLAVPIWLAYVVFVGADFMEFRFLVPIMPILAMLGAFLLDRYSSAARQLVLVGALAFASLGHIALPSLGYPVHTFHDLRVWPTESPYSLKEMGATLADAFPGGLDQEDQVSMAFGSLGVLPYYSQLPTIDLLGLTDAFVARNGEPLRIYYPGHLRIAPIDYLEERGVNIVATSRIDEPIDPDRTSYRLSEIVPTYPVVDLKDLNPEAQVLEIPIDDQNAWIAIYLTPDPLVDEAIRREGWRALPIDPTCVDEEVHFLVQLFGSKTCPS